MDDRRLKWELIKMEIRSLTMVYSKKNHEKFEKGLEKRLQVLDEKINANMTDVNLESIVKKHEHLKNELQPSYEKRAEGAIFRSKARWVEEGEKPTKYFLNTDGEKKFQ